MSGEEIERVDAIDAHSTRLGQIIYRSREYIMKLMFAFDVGDVFRWRRRMPKQRVVEDIA